MLYVACCVYAGWRSSCGLGSGIHAESEQYGTSRETGADEGHALRTLDWCPPPLHHTPLLLTGVHVDGLQKHKKQRRHGVGAIIPHLLLLLDYAHFQLKLSFSTVRKVHEENVISTVRLCLVV